MGENNSFIFTVCVESVPLYHFKPAQVVFHMAVKEFFKPTSHTHLLFMCQIVSRMLGFLSHECSVIHDERLRAYFHLVSYWLPRLMQAIPGEIKTLVILTSNEMPDEDTDQNTKQPPYRLTFFFS